VSTGAVVGIVVGSVVGLVLLLLLITWLARRGKRGGGQRFCGNCRQPQLPQWERCYFCGWAPAARLEFILGPMAGHVIELRDEVTTVGSVAGNTVVLADPAVSRKHAGIRRVEGGYELADFGSTNGIYVNGHRMPKKLLAGGDVIRVGNSELIFRRE
jgi:hypothetical protein